MESKTISNFKILFHKWFKKYCEMKRFVTKHIKVNEKYFFIPKSKKQKAIKRLNKLWRKRFNQQNCYKEID